MNQSARDVLTQSRAWVNWNPETKAPINPNTGKAASTTDPETWGVYDETINYDSSHIGYVFTEWDGLVGVDIDDCVKDGAIDERAREIIDTINSYSEYSPSGKGVHVITYGKIPRGLNNQTKGVEMYSERRYFTMTWSHVPGTPWTINRNQEGLNIIFEKYRTSDPNPQILEANIIPHNTWRNKFGNSLEEIRSNPKEEKLDRLLSGDNTGYPSPSEADMATAQKLYFYAYDDNEIAGILQEYRPNGRNNPEKLRRKGYIQRTISKINRGEQVKGPINRKVTDLLTNVKTEEKTEKNNISKYFKETKDGKHIFQYEAMVEDILRDFNIITFKDSGEMWIYNQEKGHYTKETEPTIRVYMNDKLGQYYRKHHSIEVIHQVQNRTFRDRLETKPPQNMLNLRNGVLDLENLQLYPVGPEYFFTTQWPVQYIPDAPHRKFRQFIKRLKKKERKLKRFTGYVLIESNKYKKALLVHGPTDTGKSTFAQVLERLVGKTNYCSISLQRLEQRFQLRRLYGKALNIYGDMDSRAFSAISAFKMTTGNDPLEAEVKGSNNMINFTWGGKHVFVANDLPEAKGDADKDEFYNRLITVEFTDQIAPEEQNRNLIEELTTPEELSDILNWAIEGLQDLEQNEGFDPEPIEKIREQYKRAASPVYSFVQDHCEVDIEAYTIKEESYTAHVKYCHHHGLAPKGKTQFYEDLLRHCPGIMTGRETVDGKTPQVWKYLKLVNIELLEETNQPPETQQPRINQY